MRKVKTKTAKKAPDARRSAHDIRIKRVYDPPSSDDGLRILIDRLWPRGLTKSRSQA